MTYRIPVSVNVEFTVEVEANSREEARELAENLAYTEYLTADPDELNAVAL
jgi:hypothetical protein